MNGITKDPYSSYQRLQFDWPAQGVLRITMSNPGRLNAADARMHGELMRVWRDVDEDERVRAAIICGADGAFSAGGDLDLVQEMTEDFDVLTRVWKEARDLVYNLVNCSKPLVSAMQGPAVGAGLVAGLLADVSIAAEDARIIDGHTRLGVAAGDHAAQKPNTICCCVNLCQASKPSASVWFPCASPQGKCRTKRWKLPGVWRQVPPAPCAGPNMP